MASPARPNLFAVGRTARQGRRLRPRRGDAGFTLIELMVAMSIFAVLMTSFGLLFSSSLKAYRFARARTVADQLGSGEIEKARQVSWDNLGTVAGNPPGTLVASQVVTVGAASYTVTRRVELIDDPVPTYGYNTGANYKRVVITVSSPAMTKALSYETLVAPPTQPSLYSGVVKATVLDTFNGVLSGATVAVSGGPSPLRSDATNSAGKASFAALAPTTVAQPNYTVTPSMVGWKLDPADAGAQTMSLSAGQTQTPSYHLYKPVTLTVYVVDLGGAPVTTPTTLTVTNTAGTVTDTRSFSSPTGSLVMSTFGTGDFVPNYAYVFTGSSVGYTTSPAQTSSPLTPAGYPATTDASVTVTIPIPARVSTTLAIVDKNTAAPLAGVTGTLTGGPDGPHPFTSDAAGNATFTLLPAPYAISVTTPPSGYFPYSGALTVPAGNTTPINTTVQLRPFDPPVTSTFVLRNGSTLLGLPTLAFTLSGGPSGTVNLTTDATGTAVTALVPGTYTVSVPTAPSGLLPYTGTVTVSAPGTTNVDLPVAGAVTLRTRDSATSAALGSVPVILVGPSGTTNVTTAADGSFLAYLPPGAYSVTVTAPPSGYAPYAGTLTVTAGGMNANVNLVKVTVVTFVTKRTTDGNNLGNVALTLVGPSGTVVVTTNGSGAATQSLLPGTYMVTAPSPGSGYQAYSGTLTVAGATQAATISINSTAVDQMFRSRANGGSGGIGGVTVTLTGAGGTYTFTGTTGSGGAGKSTVNIVPGTYTVSVAVMPSGYTTLVTTSLSVPDGGTGGTIYIYFS